MAAIGVMRRFAACVISAPPAEPQTQTLRRNCRSLTAPFTRKSTEAGQVLWKEHARKLCGRRDGVTEGTRTPDLRDHNPTKSVPGSPG